MAIPWKSLTNHLCVPGKTGGISQHLRPKVCYVLIPYTFEQRPIFEVASTLGIPEKAAYARMRLARAALVRNKGNALNA
jgi:DNA-directed RNA polymerase specialized sigma24 family protein